ncbi:MAG TPA: class II aldolase/adducin family protein [Candidatus Cloacimonadota bacterium]|nr:class II aldolase/adducin family protein [Candidatus Cloacimonadota bacterium]
MALPDLAHKALSETLEQLSSVADCIYRNGWAEANAGNVSIDVSSLLQPDYDPHRIADWYIVSRTGSRYRQMAQDPIPNLVLISVGKTEQIYPNGARPTSEWQSHYRLQKALPGFECILHTHPAEVIAFGHKYSDMDVTARNELLAHVLPELPLYLPEGIAFAEYQPPGSIALAEASIRALSNQKALVWSGHGLLCFGHDPDDALDYSEIICKACKIALML